MPGYDVFLSHNNSDKQAVEAIAHTLAEHGINPWLDKWNLVPGDPWQPKIEQALAQSATCAVFLGPSGIGPWQHEEMRAAIDRRVAGRAFRVIPVLLPGADRGHRDKLPTFLVATTWVEFRTTLEDSDALHRLICGIRGMEPGRGEPGKFAGECPYRGLSFFDVQDSRWFFGREAQLQWMLDGLRPDRAWGMENRFLAIVGASGSGKSSLARAGMLAALKRGELPDSQDWPQIVLRPESRPLESLASAVAGILPIQRKPSAISECERELLESEQTLHIYVRLALSDTPNQRRIIFLVDQFEEIFTLCSSEADRRAFIDNLLWAATVPQGRTIVLIAMRADFYGKCAAYANLTNAITAHQELIGPLDERQLRDAIEMPARLAGCELEPGLADLLLTAVHGQPGSLPLLQDILLELWRTRTGNRLTVEAYNAAGGLGGALAKRADKVYGSLSEREQALARRIFLRLTRPGEGTEETRVRAKVENLVNDQDPEPEVLSVVGKLAHSDVRLLVIDDISGGKGATVDIAHEALIGGWPRFKFWIEENRENLQVLRRLALAAEEWERLNRDESGLLRGRRLDQIREWQKSTLLALNALEREFLSRSIELSEREAVQIAEHRRRESDLEEMRRRLRDYEARYLATQAGLLKKGLLALLLGTLAASLVQINYESLGKIGFEWVKSATRTISVLDK